MPATINAILTTTLTMPMMVMAAMMVQQLDRRADHEAMDLGDPLRGRALRSNRAARDFHCNPCRLRALRALRTPFARRLAALTAACRTADARRQSGHCPDGRRISLAPALRAALVTVLASLALAGCAGYALRLGP